MRLLRRFSGGAPGRLALLVLLCLCLAACQTELHQGLSENAANEMLGALLEHGIFAEKANQGKKGFAVLVDDADQLRALNLLRDLGLPKPEFDSLGSVFRKEGMVSSEIEERARLSYALSQQIADSCSRLDGVVSANVHVVLSARDLVSGTSSPASAAVMLRYVPDAPVDLYVSQIQKMVVQAVPDISAERVAVLLFPVQGNITRLASPAMTRVLGVQTFSGHEKAIYAVCAVFFALGAALGAGACFAWLRARRRKEAPHV